MSNSVLQLDPRDNVLVALKPLEPGEVVHYGAESCAITQPIPSSTSWPSSISSPAILSISTAWSWLKRWKRFRAAESSPRATCGIAPGPIPRQRQQVSIAPPDASAWTARTFMGYHRADGQVGTRNYWIVIPLVFCENRNVDRMREALDEELGYGSQQQLSSARAAADRGAIERQAPLPLSQRTRMPIASSPISTAFDSSPTQAVAAARGRMRRRFAACSPGTFIIPTWPAQRC